MADFSTSVTHRLGPDRRPTDSDLVLSPGLWMTTDRERATAYLNFAQYPSFEDMLEFAAAVRARLEREGIRNLVIDLRENGGGDFYMGLVLSSDILQVDTLDWQYGIYVLIGRHTFSAAMSNAAQFRQILNARLVGEPTGGNPVAYGEAGMFHLPHSGWPVMYSKRFYRFQANDTPGVQPDIPVDTSFAGMRDGRDDVLDWVLRDIAERSARARREQEQTP
jgi:C-terminal processing protease CtpA/Prc